jgi:hypothetical protein
VEKRFGFFLSTNQIIIYKNKKKKTEQKKAVAYRWSALADEGGPAAAPWTCAA